MVGTVAKGRMFKNFMAAAAGELQEISAWFDWLEAGGKETDKAKFGLHEREVDLEGIVVHKDGSILIYEDRLYPYQLHAPFYALGSGGLIAMGALAAGCSAYRAIKIASQYDTATGGDIKLLTFRRPRAAKKVK